MSEASGPEPSRPGTAFGSGYVVTGCSGSGKSTLVAALAECGERVVEEPGRRIVREQLATGGDGLPWSNPQRFAELCAARALRDFDRHAPTGRRTFFDRGLVDVASAVERLGLHPPAGLEEALRSRRYAPLVFVSPPWRALFRPDRERRHTFEDAVAEYEALVPAYRRRGYEVVLLSRSPVTERVAVVLAAVSSRTSNRLGSPAREGR